MQTMISIADFVEAWKHSPFAQQENDPWLVTTKSDEIVAAVMLSLSSEYRVVDGVAAHTSARIECGATIKAPSIVGPGCFISGSALLRGGTYLERDCTIGPCCELKSSFMFAGSKLAHLNFVGDSIIGSDVNIEAGAIIANYRNEFDDKRIHILVDGTTIVSTNVTKFGALVGDHGRIGANAVIAPGALLRRRTYVPRLQLVDQRPQD